ncbi:MAG: endonuclease IV, partial [Clostridia bacterium]|nr:endonuclease IV [Clostridia bacterium]
NLKAVHINDSKNPIGSHKDRHEKIGQGYIGIDAMKEIINNRYLKNLPFILETPHDDIQGYAEEIKMLRNLYE